MIRYDMYCGLYADADCPTPTVSTPAKLVFVLQAVLGCV